MMACQGDSSTETSYLRCDLKVPFSSSEEAKIAHNTLSVDPEPRKGLVSKQLTVKDKNLYVTIRSKKATLLRVAVNSFMDHLRLVIQTVDEFSLNGN